MIDVRTFLGIPIDFEDICKIYPPTVQQVVEESQAISGYRLLTQTQEDIEDSLKGRTDDSKKIPTPFEFVLINAYSNKQFKEMVEKAFALFTKKNVAFVYEQKLIIIGTFKDFNTTDVSKLKVINSDNFFDFQNCLRIAMGESIVELPPADLSPVALKVYKAGRRRERIARKGNNKGISLEASLCAICCMGIGITPLNIREMTYASVLEISKMWQRKEKYRVDIDSLLAGADAKKIKPKYWIREDSDYQEVKI